MWCISSIASRSSQLVITIVSIESCFSNKYLLNNLFQKIKFTTIDSLSFDKSRESYFTKEHFAIKQHPFLLKKFLSFLISSIDSMIKLKNRQSLADRVIYSFSHDSLFKRVYFNTKNIIWQKNKYCDFILWEIRNVSIIFLST